MKITLPPFPQMEDALRLFARREDRPVFVKRPRPDAVAMEDYLTANGEGALVDLISFVLRLATLAHGGCEGCEEITVAQMIDNFRAIIRGEETGD